MTENNKSYKERYKELSSSKEFQTAYTGKSIGEIINIEQ